MMLRLKGCVTLRPAKPRRAQGFRLDVVPLPGHTQSYTRLGYDTVDGLGAVQTQGKERRIFHLAGDDPYGVLRRTKRLQTCCRYKPKAGLRSEEHTSELQSLMRISYAVFCLKKKTNTKHKN